MLSFKQYNESLTTAYPFRLLDRGGTTVGPDKITDHEASFRTDNDEKVIVEFEPYERRNNETPVMIGISFARGGSNGITGEGDAFRIFATVIAATKAYMEKFPQIEAYQFSAEKNPTESFSTSRVDLYRALVKKFGTQFDIEENEKAVGTGSFVYFTLKKKKDK